MLVQLGLPKENIIVCDRNGVIFKGRNVGMDPIKEKYASETKDRTLAEALVKADVFLGLSGPNVTNAEDISKMAKAPLVMALSNPTPEIMPEEVRKGKPDAVICTGRSDYPNQVNNVLCFPFIFRGALDVGATAITEEMKVACVHALAQLARKEATAEVAAVYGDEDLEFGLNHMIPKPFDPRLIVELPIAVAKAAIECGVATRPITDWESYSQQLQSYTYRTHMVMRPIFSRAKKNPQRVVYCEGEEEKVLRAVQIALDDGLVKPIVIGRRNVVETRLKRLHLRAQLDEDIELIDPEHDPRYREYWMAYHEIMQRRGVTPAVAKNVLRSNPTVIGALMVRRGIADALIAGTTGQFRSHMKDIIDIIGLAPGVHSASALNALILPQGAFFMCDTQVNACPSVEQLSEMTLLAAEQVRRFGLKPKVALLSHSNFGTYDSESALKMRAALTEIRARAPELEIDGEMHGDSALSDKIRAEVMPNSTLQGQANIFVMPNIDAANICFNMLKILADGISIGPLILGIAQPAYILTPSATARGIVNMTAIATLAAQMAEPPGFAAQPYGF